LEAWEACSNSSGPPAVVAAAVTTIWPSRLEGEAQTKSNISTVFPQTHHLHVGVSMTTELPPPLQANGEANKDASSGGPVPEARNLFPVAALCYSVPCLPHTNALLPALLALGTPSSVTHALLVPVACSCHGSAHPEVTFPCPRDICPGSTSKVAGTLC
jgi:hypothetical protein